MPIYEYRCESCGHDVEAIQKMSADPLKTCESCGEDALRRLISKTSFVLKGGGWYVTDYGGKKTHGADAKGGESKPAASSDSAKSTETAKPAASSDA